MSSRSRDLITPHGTRARSLPASTLSPSSNEDGLLKWPEKTAMAFMNKLKDTAEKSADNAWAIDVIKPEGYENLLHESIPPRQPQRRPSTTRRIHQPPRRPLAMRQRRQPQHLPSATEWRYRVAHSQILYKKTPGSTETDDAPKMPAFTDCNDLLLPVQTYQAYYPFQFQRFKEGL